MEEMNEYLSENVFHWHINTPKGCGKIEQEDGVKNGRAERVRRELHTNGVEASTNTSTFHYCHYTTGRIHKGSD